MPLLAAFAFFVGGSMVGGMVSALAAPMAILGLITLVWTLRENPQPHESVERVTLERGALAVGAEEIPLGRIADAMIIPGPSFPRVLIERRGPNLGPLEIVVRSVAQGRTILRALGYDATQRTFSSRAASWLRATWPRALLSMIGVVLAGFVAMLGAGLVGVPPLFALLAVVVPFAVLSAIPTKIAVGADGVYLKWLHWKRFIPLAAIGGAELYVERRRNNQRVGVTIMLVDGEPVSLALGNSWDLSRAQALVERIQEVVGDARRGDAATAAEALLRVRERLVRTSDTTAGWLRALRALGTGVVESYRAAPVEREALLRVVEDVTARPTERAAAAVALAAQTDPETRAKIRVASETVAEPKLRVALERVLDDDEAALEAAVEELAAEEARG